MLAKTFFERSSTVVLPIFAVGLFLFPLSANAQSKTTQTESHRTIHPEQGPPIDDFSKAPSFLPTKKNEALSGPTFTALTKDVFRTLGGVAIQGGTPNQQNKVLQSYTTFLDRVTRNDFKQCLANAPLVENQRVSPDRIADKFVNSKVAKIRITSLEEGIDGRARVKIDGETLKLDKSFVDSSSLDEIASVIGHELAHNYGFSHKKHDTGNKFKHITVPEQVESCIGRRAYYQCPNNEICWKNSTELTMKTSASPAITTFNGRLHMAWKANDSSNNIYISAFDGSKWQSANEFVFTELSFKTSAAPALAVYNGRLYMALKANDSSNNIYVSSFDGSKWEKARELSFKTSAAPALAVYDGRLYMALKANDSSNNIYVSSFDGSKWEKARELDSKTSAAPALAANNNSLFVAWKANDSSNNIYVRRFDGANWQDRMELESKTSQRPSLAFYQNSAYLAFKANDSSNNIYIQKQH